MTTTIHRMDGSEPGQRRTKDRCCMQDELEERQRAVYAWLRTSHPDWSYARVRTRARIEAEKGTKLGELP
jgi:hypothetical protein